MSTFLIVCAAVGLPTLLGLGLTYYLFGGRKKSRIDYAAALQKMAIDQTTQFDHLLDQSKRTVGELEQKVTAMNVAMDALLARARRAEEESALRGQALIAAGLPVPAVPAPNVAGGN